MPDFSSLDDSRRVCEDGVREKVDVRGPRCVSLSSKYGLRSLVTGSFHVWAVDDSEFNRLLAKVTLRWYSTVGFS